MSAFYDDPFVDDAGVKKSRGGPRAAGITGREAPETGRLVSGNPSDVPALIASKINPRFARRLRARLSRL